MKIFSFATWVIVLIAALPPSVVLGQDCAGSSGDLTTDAMALGCSDGATCTFTGNVKFDNDDWQGLSNTAFGTTTRTGPGTIDVSCGSGSCTYCCDTGCELTLSQASGSAGDDAADEAVDTGASEADTDIDTSGGDTPVARCTCYPCPGNTPIPDVTRPLADCESFGGDDGGNCTCAELDELLSCNMAAEICEAGKANVQSKIDTCCAPEPGVGGDSTPATGGDPAEETGSDGTPDEAVDKASEQPTSTPPVVVTTPAPGPATQPTTGTPAPGGGGTSFTPSFTFQQCTTAMAFSDISRDGVLEQNEYLRFINRLSSNAYLGMSFDTITQPLQTNFETLAEGENGIDIAGSAPGKTPSAEEQVHLENICTSTDKAIQGEPDPDPTPTSAPVPTTPTTSATTPATTQAPVPGITDPVDDTASDTDTDTDTSGGDTPAARCTCYPCPDNTPIPDTTRPLAECESFGGDDGGNCTCAELDELLSCNIAAEMCEAGKANVQSQINTCCATEPDDGTVDDTPATGDGGDSAEETGGDGTPDDAVDSSPGVTDPVDDTTSENDTVTSGGDTPAARCTCYPCPDNTPIPDTTRALAECESFGGDDGGSCTCASLDSLLSCDMDADMCEAGKASVQSQIDTCCAAEPDAGAVDDTTPPTGEDTTNTEESTTDEPADSPTNSPSDTVCTCYPCPDDMPLPDPSRKLVTCDQNEEGCTCALLDTLLKCNMSSEMCDAGKASAIMQQDITTCCAAPTAAPVARDPEDDGDATESDYSKATTIYGVNYPVLLKLATSAAAAAAFLLRA